MAVGTLGVQALFQRSLQLGPPLQPWFPTAALVPLSLLPVLPRPAVPWLESCWLCCARCQHRAAVLLSLLLLCSRNCSQGGFKLGTFSNSWISVVFKRLLVTQSDFSARHMGRSPEILQCGCSLPELPMSLCSLGLLHPRCSSVPELFQCQGSLWSSP